MAVRSFGCDAVRSEHTAGEIFVELPPCRTPFEQLVPQRPTSLQLQEELDLHLSPLRDSSAPRHLPNPLPSHVRTNVCEQQALGSS